MDKTIYHQARNTKNIVITSFPYDYNHWEFNSPHFHKNYELLLAVKGSFECFVNEDNYILEEGNAIIIQPFQIHGLKVHDGSLVWCTTFAEIYFKGISTFLEKKRAINPVFHPDPLLKDFFIDRIDRYIGRRKEFSPSQISKLQESVFKSCVYAMGSAFLEQVDLVNTNTAENSIVVEIIQYISENFKTNLTLNDISDALGYSYQYLSKVFNNAFGISFKQMLNRYRLEYAISQLGESNLSITQICFDSGFQSMRSFDHTCKEFYNKSPKEIRNELKI